MQHLNKETFWDNICAKYPDAFADFSKWIDSYKEEVNWNTFFGEKVKFHDLPFEMQTGILNRYELELFNNQYGKGKEIYLSIAERIRCRYIKLFIDVQTNIINEKAKLN